MAQIPRELRVRGMGFIYAWLFRSFGRLTRASKLTALAILGLLILVMAIWDVPFLESE
jgi:hypothetical protein